MPTLQEHCCGTDKFFDRKTAEKQYKEYLKKGPSRVSAKIIEQLKPFEPKGKSMIDIGGGIGTLQWWFLENGGNKTIGIDASSGYLEKAKKHAKEKGWLDRTEFLMGDCTDVYPNIASADFITLDKVICCYPNYIDIIESTCKKQPKYISLSYPMDGVISDGVRALGALALMLTKNSYRPFVHKVKDVRNLFKTNGYKRVAYNLAFPWHIETYKKLH